MTEILFIALILSIFEGFENKKFYFKRFFKNFAVFFIFGIIFIKFIEPQLDKVLPDERYGVWVMGGILLFCSLYLSIKSFIKSKK
jgi:uncharacterized membrane protein YjjP (DUF1212 family)